MFELFSEVELVVSDLNVDGSAVAVLSPAGGRKTEAGESGARGRVVFVDQGLPGELLLARIHSIKKNICFARKLRTLIPSPHYTEPFCQYFGLCGGCALQNLSYPAQLEFKRQRVRQALARIGGVKVDKPEILPSPELTAYRNKMEYAFADQGTGNDAPVLGLRRRGGRETLDMEGCPLQSREAALALGAVRSWSRAGGFSAWKDGRGALRYLVLREPEYRLPAAQRCAELICGDSPPGGKDLDFLQGMLAELKVSSLLITRRLSGYNVAQGEYSIKRYGLPVLWEKFGGLLLEFPLSGFAQTNTRAAALLYARTAELAALSGEESLWDVYSGSGALALYLGGRCKSVWGAEKDTEAVRAARRNAARLGFSHCVFEAGDAGTLLQRKTGSPDILAVDPPRAGLSPAALAGIKKAAPRKIIYVSCEAATLARDIRRLSSGDAPRYGLAGLFLADLFPHTPHVEAVALLVRCNT
jgi:23S rRNA (uracil1939-C5)-methyltransferase